MVDYDWPASVRRPVYWDDVEQGWYPVPRVGVDYIEDPPRSCFYVPQERFWNQTADGKLRRGHDRVAVYRLLGMDCLLLYVGLGTQPETRWQHHKHSKPWWDDVLVKTVDWYDSRIDAEIAEYLAIRHEYPRHNVVRRYPPEWRSQWYEAKEEIKERFPGSSKDRRGRRRSLAALLSEEAADVA